MKSPCNYKELEELIVERITDGLMGQPSMFISQFVIENIANTLMHDIAEFVGYKHVELKYKEQEEKINASNKRRV